MKQQMEMKDYELYEYYKPKIILTDIQMKIEMVLNL